jgi:hypothetical protein
MNNQNELIIYQDKNKKIEVQLKEETIWLDTHKIARVFREIGRGKHRKYLPYAFTEQGVAMLSVMLSIKYKLR